VISFPEKASDLHWVSREWMRRLESPETCFGNNIYTKLECASYLFHVISCVSGGVESVTSLEVRFYYADLGIKFNSTKFCFDLISNAKDVIFQVLTEASRKTAVFWVSLPCSLVEVYRRFRGSCSFRHQNARRRNPEDSHIQRQRCVNVCCCR
jgi:hypothetical protein